MKKKIIGFLIKIQIKNSKSDNLFRGFTLIELLVAIILTFLIIGPLMQFMVDVMTSDQKEQAKATSQQEIQSALDYIAQDMEQAVYIYNADGLYGLSASKINGIYNSTPQILGAGTGDKTMTPVLAFWKRYFYKSSQNVTLSTGTTQTVGCLTNSSFTSTPSGGSNGCNNQDYMVYSLVVYYLVNNSVNWTTSSPWNKNTQRIVRWEIRDGIYDTAGTQTCSNVATPTAPATTPTYALCPDPNFSPFNLSSTGSLSTQLGNWTSFTGKNTAYTAQQLTLVDYIDPTSSSSVTPSPAACDTSTNTSTGQPNEEQVPSYSTASYPNGNSYPAVDSSFQTGSFYVCVNSSNNTARVYIRGNALARLQSNNTAFNTQQPLFFPTASIQVKGRGFLGSQ